MREGPYVVDPDPTRRFFAKVMLVGRYGAQEIEVHSKVREDPRWVTNGYGSKDVSLRWQRHRFGKVIDSGLMVARPTDWVLKDMHGRYAYVSADAANVTSVKLDLADPDAVLTLAFHATAPDFAIEDPGVALWPVWLGSKGPPIASLRREFGKKPVKRIPVPGTEVDRPRGAARYRLIEVRSQDGFR